MDEAAFKELVGRLTEANKVVGNLDPAIRADAFALMAPYVAGDETARPRPGRIREAKRRSASSPSGKPSKASVARKAAGSRKPASQQARAAAPASESEEALVEQHLNDDDAENALLALAIFFGRHGRIAFELPQLKAIAQQFNLNVPKRMDKFFVTARRGDDNDKKLVVRKQEDGWKIQPSGATWLSDTYGVKLGRQPLPSTDA